MSNPTGSSQPQGAKPEWVTFGGPGVDELMVNPAVMHAAAQLLERIYDPVLVGNAPGLPTKKVTGTCRVCTAERQLTFEHLPPQSTGNKQRARGGNSWQILMQGANIGIPPRGWFSLQRGVGAHVLCGDCNSFCGRKYVPSYTEADQLIEQAITSHARPTPTGPGYPARIALDFQGFLLGDIGRQAIAMLLAASGGGSLARLHPELPDAVLNGGSDLGGLRLGLSLAFGDQIRLSPPMVMGGKHGVTVFAEVAAAPFRWALTWSGDGLVPLPGTVDVTHWLDIAPGDATASEPLELSVGAIVSAAPGDMRDLATIQKQIRS